MDGTSEQRPRFRLASRVLLVDPSDRLLLFRAGLPTVGELWLAAGGGVDDGESLRAR